MASGLQNIETVESPFRKFVTTIGVFPTAFTDAMTYYECLAYLVKYMDETLIPAINENAEATEELQKLFIELKSFVDNYFDNLDVQTEIDNKLDQMAEDGTLQEIIGNYLEASVPWTFDTVAAMKSSTNLVNGSYAKTLGFHTLNDGGGAFYKITNEGTANEKDVIAIGNLLFAHLVYGDTINVKQIGAYGDGETDDKSIFEHGVTLATSENAVLYAPDSVYKIESELVIKSIVFRCDGQIDNDVTLVLGGNANGSTRTSVYIRKCNDVKVEGAKNSLFDIEECGGLTLYADGNTSNIASMAYNKFNGSICNGITLNGINGGWINENEFNIKRCEGNLTITGDGSYRHNNNHFNNICIEGATRKIKIDHGYCNYITYRGESYPIIETNTNPNLCYGNVIERQYYTQSYNSVLIGNTTSANFTNLESMPTYKCQRIMELDKYSVKNLNATMYLNTTGELFGYNWTYFYDSGKVDASLPFIIKVKADKACFRPYIICYDDNGDKIDGNVTGTNITSSDHEYFTNSNVSENIVAFFPSDAVKKIQVRYRIGSNVSLNTLTIDLYQPFSNTLTMKNIISTTRKYNATIPSGIVNAKWDTGDIVWSSAPTTSVAGWICTDGTNNTWAVISSTSA